MVAVTLLVMSTAALSAALLAVVKSSRREQVGSLESLRATYVGEAALAEAVFDLSKGGTGDLGSKQAPLSFGNGGSYYVDAVDLGNGCTSLTATGRDRSVARIEAVIREVPGDVFRWAAFGDEVLDLTGDARVDSYDSTLGSYASQEINSSGLITYADSDGHVGSNGDVTLGLNASVWGDARPGPTGQTTLVGASATVSGSTLPLPALEALTALQVPSVASSGDLTLAGIGALGSGAYAYGNFVLGSSSILTVTGPATLVIGNMELQSGAHLLVDASSGPVEIYVLDDFVMSNDTLVSSLTSSPLDVELLLLSDNLLDPSNLDLVDFGANAQFYGTIYAPYASVDINTNFELFGGLMTKRLNLDGNARIHYDEALLSAAANAPTAYETLCWRVLGVE